MYKIKKAAQTDIEQVLTMRYTTIKSVCHLNDSYVFDENFQKQTRDYYENADQTTVIAYSSHEPIACATICYIMLMPTFDHPTGKKAHIMNVYTDERHRRQGIACQMMTMLIEEAKEKGVTEISLDATKDGRLLYEKLGFRPSGEGMVLELS